MTTNITELAQILKAAAEYYQSVQGIARYSKTADAKERFLELANPANILALVEALETEKRICATWRKTAESTSEKLEKAQAAERRWHRVASRVHEQACESNVKIDELEAIRAAAEKLVRCKGRYHSEQNYRALAALFGVTTPDLPPLDSESSAVTVKLTDINEFLAEVHDKTLNRAFRLLAEGVRAGDVAAMRAAGIKVEAE
ncbi:ead/Ea22-like family protein [Klebsiella pneumoniae]|nr:ead/Ea22-like family protein [Klebsiella pneumoniae]MRJ48630.1 ead/Ea22-like family protein [Klebsiella pneumoniae]PZE02902.1 ead/Ea22-like family protein [Klebsiella pneumoniae]PZE08818.1 ead/Ea22-like family protein [Klebsiella pneumoniae]